MPRSIQKLPLLLLTVCCLSAGAQNDKQVIGDAVFTPNEIESGVNVLFMIRFQNLGEDTVINVVIRDTLDARFDAATFEMVDASFEYELLRDEGFVRWYFNDIHLPGAESNPPGEAPNSNGFILFTVQPLRFLAPNQTIQNHAWITFDAQSPFCTNDATIWIDENAESPDLTGDHERQIKVVPNPNYGHFEVRKSIHSNSSSGSKVEWWISDMTGKTIWDGASQDMAAAPNEVMLERPAPGLYLLWVKENGGLKVERFTVLR